MFNKLLFDYLTHFALHKVMLNQQTKLFFVHFLKISQRPRLKQMQNRNKLTDLAESWCVFFQEMLLTEYNLDMRQ
uniref:Uncharacterized protein n=1 Tax=Lepeophtheirus salmonis TaxID=72036 RepID=A0A0K2UM26_LEPSM